MSDFNIDPDFSKLKHIYPVLNRLVLPLENLMIRAFMSKGLRDKRVKITRLKTNSFDGKKINAVLFESPENTDKKKPCLVYCHGGGFCLAPVDYQYRLARKYALGCDCKVLFVDYRLTPFHHYPVPGEDCYAFYKYALDHSEELNIDTSRMALGGDSAGASLTMTLENLINERQVQKPVFELLIYPVVDRYCDTESRKKFAHTPMWNGVLNKKMWDLYIGKTTGYLSPFQRKPTIPNYIEVCESDPLHDEGVMYYEYCKNSGLLTKIYNTYGTLHGYDTIGYSKITKAAVKERINALNKAFYGEDYGDKKSD